MIKKIPDSSFFTLPNACKNNNNFIAKKASGSRNIFSEKSTKFHLIGITEKDKNSENESV